MVTETGKRVVVLDTGGTISGASLDASDSIGYTPGKSGGETLAAICKHAGVRLDSRVVRADTELLEMLGLQRGRILPRCGFSTALRVGRGGIR